MPLSEVPFQLSCKPLLGTAKCSKVLQEPSLLFLSLSLLLSTTLTLSLKKKGKQHPGLYEKEHSQQMEGSDCPSLLGAH